MKILLAEDTADLNKVICAVLNHEGYDVDPAFDGEEAMERINTEGYDCLILDIMMPKKDGIGILKAIAGMEKKPITLATSCFMTEYVSTAAANLGVRYLMLKPCDMTALVERLQEIRGGENQRKTAALCSRQRNILPATFLW